MNLWWKNKVSSFEFNAPKSIVVISKVFPVESNDVEDNINFPSSTKLNPSIDFGRSSEWKLKIQSSSVNDNSFLILLQEYNKSIDFVSL